MTSFKANERKYWGCLQSSAGDYVLLQKLTKLKNLAAVIHANIRGVKLKLSGFIFWNQKNSFEKMDFMLQFHKQQPAYKTEHTFFLLLFWIISLKAAFFVFCFSFLTISIYTIVIRMKRSEYYVYTQKVIVPF